MQSKSFSIQKGNGFTVVEDTQITLSWRGPQDENTYERDVRGAVILPDLLDGEADDMNGGWWTLYEINPPRFPLMRGVQATQTPDPDDPEWGWVFVDYHLDAETGEWRRNVEPS